MIQDHTAYPNITRLVHDMSHYNGGTAARNAQRIDPDTDRERLLDECLGADGVYHENLKALDDWLGALPKDHFDTIADGEESEVAALLADAPNMGDPEDTAQDFINSLYEHTV